MKLLYRFKGSDDCWIVCVPQVKDPKNALGWYECECPDFEFKLEE